MNLGDFQRWTQQKPAIPGKPVLGIERKGSYVSRRNPLNFLATQPGLRTLGTRPSRSSRRTVTLPDRSVPHQRHQHACRGGRSSEHYGYCESAQVRPVAPPVGGLRWTRPAVMHSIRGGVEAGRQGHGCTSVVARLPTIHAGMCVNQLSDLTGPAVGRG